MSSFPKNKTPFNVNVLYRWQQDYADEQGIDANRLQYRVTASVIAAACAAGDSGDAAIIMKGGASLDARYGTQARFSDDVDFSIRLAIAPNGLDELERRLDADWEGFTFDLRDREQIADHDAWRYDLRVLYKGKHYKRLKLEVGVTDGSDMAVETIDMPVDLRLFGFANAPARVGALGLHEQVAQKLHACSTRYDVGENDRVRDLPDIYLMTRDGCDLHLQRVACVRVFAARDKHPWPPELVPEPGWPDLYAEMLGEHPQIEPKTLDEAVAYVRDLIARIDAAE